jgi:hypothetical protein
VVIIAAVAVLNRYNGAGRYCTVLGTGVAHADEDCLQQDAISMSWAQAQQQQMTMAGAAVTTGLLFTEASGADPVTLTSGEDDDNFTVAWKYLQTAPGIRGQPQGSRQVAGHVEAKAAARLRHEGHTYGVLVINNPAGPCPYGSGIGCGTAMMLIMPRGSEIVVWWPGGRHGTYLGRA